MTSADGCVHDASEVVRLAGQDSDLDASPRGIFGLGRDGRCLFANRASTAMFGYSVDELLGADIHALIHHSRPDGSPFPPDACAIHSALHAAHPAPASEAVCWHRDGHPVRVAYRMSSGGSPGTPVAAVVVLDDITGQAPSAGAHSITPASLERAIDAVRAMEAQLLRQSTIDRLTGLPNRVLLGERLTTAVEHLAGTRSAVAVLFVDIDHFKVVNDGLGHGVGDRLLRLVAHRLHATVRPGDTVARFGGDEFVVVCEGVAEAEASAIAQRILKAVAQPATIAGHRLVGAVSIGIVVTTDADRSPDDLLRDADAAMYLAKQEGRGRAATFDGPLRRKALARFQLGCALPQALELGQLGVAYQPVVAIAGGRLVGAEALLRWRHPTLGAIAPADFIPVAEETGAIVALGAWVLRSACRDLAGWSARWGHDRDWTISVNLSCRQLRQPDLIGLVASVLEETGTPPSALCLEITETVLMEESKLVAGAIEWLHELGVTLAVDDFGTGYSSLLCLRRLPVQILKLDRAFVAGLGRNPTDTAIVRSTIDLAHSLGMQALAEGIERPEQLELLSEMGCDLGQGYLWGIPTTGWQPVPSEEGPAAGPVTRGLLP